MPDSISNCGELIAPPHSTTSREARTTWLTPPCENATPVARVPANKTRSASALVITRRFARFIAGFKNAFAADIRKPFFEVC